MSVRDARAILTDRLAVIRDRIAAACARVGRSPSEVSLIAVTKSVGIATAGLLPQLGVVDLAESRPQELWRKATAIPEARWHLIGHLQRNKIDRTLPLVACIHSVDRLALLAALEAEAQRCGRIVPALLEFNVSREAAKHGFTVEEWPALIEPLRSLRWLRVDGLMGLAAYTEDPETARPAFRELRQLRDSLTQRLGQLLPVLSMGMSGDFEVAIEEGATAVRLGTVLFEGLS